MHRLLPLLLSAFFLGGCASSAPAAPTLFVTALNVGKADCLLLKTENFSMLIDTGTADTGGKVRRLLTQNHITTLDYLVLSHLDQDHIGGVPAVLDTVKVTHLVQPAYTLSSKEYTAYRESADKHGIQPEELTEDCPLERESLHMTLLPPKEAVYDESNDYSLFVDVTYGSHRFLFTGDAEKIRLREFLNGENSPYTFLKVPHHGQSEKNSVDFFEAVSPVYALITCSAEDPPDKKVLESLQKIGAKVYRTDHGTVVFASDGKTLKVKQS